MKSMLTKRFMLSIICFALLQQLESVTGGTAVRAATAERGVQGRTMKSERQRAAGGTVRERGGIVRIDAEYS